MSTAMARTRTQVPVRARQHGRSLQGLLSGRRVLELNLPTNSIGMGNVRSNFVILPNQGRTEGIFQDYQSFTQFSIPTGGPGTYASDNDSQIALQQTIRSKTRGKFLAMISASVVVAGTLPAGYTADKLEQLVFQRSKFRILQGGKEQHHVILSSLRQSESNDRGGLEAPIFADPQNFPDTVFTLEGAGLPAPAAASWTIDVTINHYWEDIPQDVYEALVAGGYQG